MPDTLNRTRPRIYQESGMWRFRGVRQNTAVHPTLRAIRNMQALNWCMTMNNRRRVL